MKLLLDTHAILWWWSDDPALPPSARAVIEDAGNEIFVSAASAWEVATKFRLGKLPGYEEAIGQYDALMVANGFHHLPISEKHAIGAGSFPQPHRDPFDRMIAAQAHIEGMAVVSRDPALAEFGCRLLW
ncbi:MAG: type II toxin-antitoxin system VapC family toxin [Sphingobium sp.]